MARRSSVLVAAPALAWTSDEKEWLTGHYIIAIPPTTQAAVDSLLRDSFLGNLVPYSVGSAQEGRDTRTEADFATHVLEAPSVTLSVAQKSAEVLHSVVDWFAANFTDPNGFPSRCMTRIMKGLENKLIGRREASSLVALVEETAIVCLLELLERVGERFNQLTQFHFITTNVTRRVLSHVRDCLVPKVMTEEDLRVYLSEFEAGTGEGDAVRWECSNVVSAASRQGGLFELTDATGGFCPNEPGVQTSGGVLAADLSDEDEEGQLPLGDLRKYIDAAAAWKGSRGAHGQGPVDTTQFPAMVQTPIRHIVETRCGGRTIDVPRCLEDTQQVLFQYEAEFEHITTTLSKKGKEQIYDGEVVLTLGASHSTLNFFAEAAAEKKFDVVILHDGGNSHSTTSVGAAYSMAAALRHKRNNIRVQIHHFSSASAVMSAVSKVFIGCDQVLSAGGVLAPIGTHPLCIVARSFSVPVVVVTMAIKFIPWYPASAKCMSIIRFAQDITTEKECAVFSRPTDVLPLNKWDPAGLVGGFGTGNCQNQDYASENPVRGVLIANRTSEYVPPEYITMFVTDEGEFAVSQIFSQMHASESASTD